MGNIKMKPLCMLMYANEKEKRVTMLIEIVTFFLSIFSFKLFEIHLFAPRAVYKVCFYLEKELSFLLHKHQFVLMIEELFYYLG
jgi:hypothetical protein